MRSVILLATLFVVSCKFPVPEDVGEDGALADAGIDAVVTCTASTTTCSSSTLVVCDADGIGTVTTCGFGCAISGDRCNDLDPSNGLRTYLDQSANASPLVLSGNAIIDTSAGTITDGDGTVLTVATASVPATPVEILVVTVKSFEAANVKVRGTRALAIMSDGDVTIGGVMSVSAESYVPGPGSINTLDCTAMSGFANTSGGGGSGGGGYGSAGGQGGDGGTLSGGAGGAPNGNQELVPLRGGCPGAAANGADSPDPLHRRKGQGGGAIQISARGRVRLGPGAFIAANGGGAKSYTGTPLYVCSVSGPLTCHNGSGGGSGGAILIEASSIEVPATAGLVANGGAGHCSSHGQAPDGQLGEGIVAGTDCSDWTGVGNGGNGAAAATDATGGGNATNGGGGGGGVGRIRINLPSGATFDGVTPIVSPSPSVGSVALR